MVFCTSVNSISFYMQFIRHNTYSLLLLWFQFLGETRENFCSFFFFFCLIRWCFLCFTDCYDPLGPNGNITIFSTVFAQNLKSVLQVFTLTTVHYCILDILSKHMSMSQNIEYRRLDHEQVGFSMLCSITWEWLYTS